MNFSFHFWKRCTNDTALGEQEGLPLGTLACATNLTFAHFQNTEIGNKFEKLENENRKFLAQNIFCCITRLWAMTWIHRSHLFAVLTCFRKGTDLLRWDQLALPDANWESVANESR